MADAPVGPARQGFYVRLMHSSPGDGVPGRYGYDAYRGSRRGSSSVQSTVRPGGGAAKVEFPGYGVHPGSMPDIAGQPLGSAQEWLWSIGVPASLPGASTDETPDTAKFPPCAALPAACPAVAIAAALWVGLAVAASG